MVVDKRNFWQKLQNWQRGFLISLVVVLGAFVFLGVTTYDYTGRCFNDLDAMKGATHACSFIGYVQADFSSEYSFLVKVIFEDFWKVIALVFCLPILAGYFIDLQKWGAK